MFVADREADKGVKKYKGLTLITKTGKPSWNGKINIAKERLFMLVWLFT